jgi:hypothetical protein
MLIPSETSLEKSQSLRSDSRRWLRPDSSSLRELIEVGVENFLRVGTHGASRVRPRPIPLVLRGSTGVP